MTHVFRRFFKISLNKKARKSAVSSKLELITLEERITPAIYTVLNNNDLGPDSLRRAIVDSNLTPESDIINFSLAPGTIITLSSALPAIDKTATAGTLTITGLGSSFLTISGNNGNSGCSYLTIALSLVTASQFNCFCRVLLTAAGETTIIIDSKFPTSGVYEFFLSKVWDSGGNNALRIRTSTPGVIVENLRCKIYG
jgi:hypothetical protein